MFFSDMKIDRYARIGIDNPVYKFNDRPTSHRSSWAFLMARQMKELGYSRVEVITDHRPWRDYDVIVLHYGMEYQGTFNLFGGASDELADSLQRILDYTGIIISAEMPIQPIWKLVADRMKTGTERFRQLRPLDFQERLKDVPHFEKVYGSKKAVLGDSHALAAWHPGHEMFRNDGKTMFGALNQRFETLLEGQQFDEVVFYFGNIDVRHHLMRQKEHVTATLKLIDWYAESIRDFQDEWQVNKISIVGLLPIEHEGRRLPKTGYYEGTPFYGTQQERAYLVDKINIALQGKCYLHPWTYIGWPEPWYKMDPEEYADKHMEKPKSVHLARHSYLYNMETGRSSYHEA